jgi:predicted transposase YbfD/YdcC
LALTGCTVTIDAMGCQTKIAEHITDAEADYVLALKGNQGTLHEDLEKDHGRIEERCCWATSDVEGLEQKEAWQGLQSIVMIEAEREVVGKERTIERRYFIISLPAQAKPLLEAVRGHWESRTACTGVWTWRCGKMRVGFGRIMHRRMSPSCVTLRSICSSKRRVANSASSVNNSKQDEITTTCRKC